jgi:alpha-galactosidase
MACKITLIGGGSSVFTPQLMHLFLETKVLKGSTITLMDIDEKNLRLMDTLCRRLVEVNKSDLIIESTTNQRESLLNSDFVIVSIAVGGIEVWEHDIEIPAKYGVYQSDSCDTTGPGGIMRGFRHIPVLLSICQDLQEVSPDAWILNYTNPCTINAIALRQIPSVKSIGLCTIAAMPRLAQGLADHVGVDAEEIQVPALVAGINHCPSFVELRLHDGRDGLSMIKKKPKNKLEKAIIEAFGIVPYSEDHFRGYVPFLIELDEEYKGSFQGLKLKYGWKTHNLEKNRSRRRKWQNLVERWTRNEEDVPGSLSVLSSDESIEVVEIIECLLGERKTDIFAVNTLNQGAISNLPHDAVVEISSVVGSFGIKPICVGDLPENYATHLRKHIDAQKIAADAAVKGDRELALQAFLRDPLISSRLTVDRAKELLDELFEIEKPYLEHFYH